MRAVDCNVLVRLVTRDDLKQAARADAFVVRAALTHFRRKPSLGFSDCLILEVARAAGHVPMGTFARDLSKLAGAQRL